MTLFHTDEDRKAYLGLLAEFSDRFNLAIWAWCLMTNHVHRVAVPSHSESLARAIGEAHRRYTRRVNFKEGVRGHLFQERFHSFPIQHDRHLLAVVRYVENNPVRAGRVVWAEDHPWSSARYPIQGGTDRLVKSTPLPEMESDGSAFLRAEDDGSSIEGIRSRIRTGRPFGKRGWVKRLEKRLDRPLLPQTGGWPKGKPRRRARVMN